MAEKEKFMNPYNFISFPAEKRLLIPIQTDILA